MLIVKTSTTAKKRLLKPRLAMRRAIGIWPPSNRGGTANPNGRGRPYDPARGLAVTRTDAAADPLARLCFLIPREHR